MIKVIILVVCVFSGVVEIEALARRDVTPSAPLNLLGTLDENVDQFRQCVDQMFANTVGQVNEKQLQPLILAISDNLSRVAKAFEVLTAPRSTQQPPVAR